MYTHIPSVSVSVSSTRDKLQKHYEALGRTSEDSDFDGEWKEEVETKVSTCMCSSLLCDDEYLDGELHKGEIEKCVCKLKNNKTGGSEGSC